MAAPDDEEKRLRSAALQNANAIHLARRRAEQELARERERLRITLASIGDAVISTDAAGRVTFLNGVAEALTGWPQADAAGRPLPDVFRIINEHTRLTVENPALLALREGRVVGLANLTVLIARDGTERPIDDSAAPMLDADGTRLGAVLVFRDVTDRKRAEDALRESEARHRFLAELAAAAQPLTDPDAVMAVTAKMLAEHLAADRCAYAEVEAEAIFVITGDHSRGVPSIVGRWPVAAFGAECTRHMLANAPYVLNDAEADSRVGPANLPAYRATAIRAVICVPLHKEGTFTAAMAVHQKTVRHWTPAEVDLVRTVVDRCWEALERARVARTLRESEARYRAIVEATPDCVKVVDHAGTLLQMNPAGLAMVEADGHGPVGRCVYDVIAPENVAAYRAFNGRVCRGQSGTLQFEIVGLRGTRRHMETAAVPLPAPGGGFNQLAVTRDVTARVAAERDLRDGEERYRRAAAVAATAAEANAKFRAFFEQGTNFAAVLALDGTVVEPNRLCLDGCGFTREDVLGKPFWECGWWNRSPALMDMVRSACRQAAGGRVFQTETIYFLADGRRQVVDLALAPVIDAAGRVLFVAATGNDVTDRRLMEDALRDADRKKDDFIALLAHELRNPLAPVRNGLEVMRLAGANADAVTKARAMMDRQLTHMVRLVDDLLDVSRINRNKMDLRRGHVRLTDVVTSAVETARPFIDAAGHRLNVSLPSEPPLLDADLTRLAQVFSNLLTNSAKYTEPGGRIWLTAEGRAGGVAVTVRDTGIGIPAANLPTIFDMFSQVDRSIERSQGGLGIGLALVKGLVEMHGGTVTAASGGVDRGSSFTVWLPVVAPAGEPPAGAAVVTERPSAPGRRVLVVDDNRDSAVSMAMMLQLLGHQVRTAHDGVEGVEAAEAFRPELILMDVGMPRMNGYEATRRIREESWGKAVTIVALTGWGQDGDRVQSKTAGCDQHLVKPVSPEDVEKLLRELA